MKELQDELDILEHKALVYCEFYGSNSEEVLRLNYQIKEVNLKILDLIIKGDA